MKHPAFIIKQGKNDQYYYNLTAKNGTVILFSDLYTTKNACLNGVESVKKNSQYDDRFIEKEKKNGQPYFVLLARNGQVIGESESYTTKSAMENGIESVKKNAPYAEIQIIDL